MKIPQQKLLEDLSATTRDLLARVEPFTTLSEEALNWRENKEKWSILECFEHLNRYGDFYIPECRHRMEAYKLTGSNLTNFKSGLLGNYFSNLMLPSAQSKKMQSPKDMNPVFSDLDRSVLTEFTRQQKELLKLLSQSEQIDLNKVKTGISLTNWIKLKLGDTFRVVIYHNLRHVVQAEGILVAQPILEGKV
ncbi:MAG: DinB family protein [Cyclobacteriaceae bacterium]